jgi:hypothetical protein
MRVLWTSRSERRGVGRGRIEKGESRVVVVVMNEGEQASLLNENWVKTNTRDRIADVIIPLFHRKRGTESEYMRAGNIFIIYALRPQRAVIALPTL